MNRAQRASLCLGIVLAIAAGLVPPWIETASELKTIGVREDHLVSQDWPGPYRPLWVPPVVGLNHSWRGTVGVRLDWIRLVCQWFMIASLVAVLLISFGRQLRAGPLIVLWFGVGAIAVAAWFAPWSYTGVFNDTPFDSVGGYAPLFRPEKLLHDTNKLGAGLGLKLDIARLAVEWTVIVLAAAGAIVLMGKRKRKPSES